MIYKIFRLFNIDYGAYYEPKSATTNTLFKDKE